MQFEMHYGSDQYDSCDLHWYVNGIEGGDGFVGVISKCGLYTPPTRPTIDAVEIYGGEYELGLCYDCCPGSARSIFLPR